MQQENKTKTLTNLTKLFRDSPQFMNNTRYDTIEEHQAHTNL